MSDPGYRAFRAVLRKDLRLLLRDPQQILGLLSLLGSLVFMALVFGAGQEEVRKGQESAAQVSSSTQAIPTSEVVSGEVQKTLAQLRAEVAAVASARSLTPEEQAELETTMVAMEEATHALNGPPPRSVVRWVLLGLAASLSFYGSFFAIALALANFVGERERGTIEILLSTPLTDRRIFLYKIASVTLLCSTAGYALLALGAAAGAFLAPAQVWEWVTLTDLFLCGALALPLPLICCGLQVGMGALCSVRAKTTQGAGQLFGGLIVAVFIGLPSLGLAAELLGLTDPVFALGKLWLRFPFALQVLLAYGAILALLGGILRLGYALFTRERMLR